MKGLGNAATAAASAVQQFSEALPVAEEAGKLVERHPAKCEARKKEAVARGQLAKHLAEGVKSVEDEQTEDE